MKLEPLIQLPNVWSGVARGLGVHLFEGKLHVADMDRLEGVGIEYLQKHAGHIVELVVVFPGGSRMSGDERARMARLMKRWEDRRAAAATVILADGLLGAVHRSVLTGLLTLAPPGHPTKVFGAVDAALEWLHPYFSELPPPRPTLEAAEAAARVFCEGFRGRSVRPAEG